MAVGQKIPAPRCEADNCDCPDYTHHRKKGIICASCSAPWPVYEAQ